VKDDTGDDKYTIKAVTRCLQVLDLAGRSAHPLGTSDVVSALGMSSNMAFRMLSTLAASGFLTRDKNGLYAVSLKALQLSRNALLSLEIRKITQPYMELLWKEYPKANINMAVYHEGEILVIDRIDSLSIPRTYFTPGKTVPFHCTALGKMLCSELPEAALDALIAEKGLKRFTPATITSPDGLKAELERVRSEQTARDREEYIPRDNCNAAPIRGRDGSIIAALSLTAFENNMTVEEMEAALPALQNTARRVSASAGFRDLL
jgi:DNA-binding IclR family transcriptional regulator